MRSSDKSKLQSGRGQGHGENYKPYLTPRDFGSSGLSVRIKGWHSDRIHHFLSSLEVAYFYVLTWSKKINDIREQYPLPLEKTLAIAQRLSINHPPQNMSPTVMTTDFLIDENINKRDVLLARTIKYCCDLDDFRTIEKFEIERTFWHENRGTNWGIVTERDIPMGLAHNIKWLYPSVYIEDLPNIDTEDIDYYERKLHSVLSTHCSIPLSKVCLKTDQLLGLVPGISLSVARYLIATRRWHVDIMKKIEPWNPLILLGREQDQVLEIVNA
jgi:hypothetical protein